MIVLLLYSDSMDSGATTSTLMTTQSKITTSFKTGMSLDCDTQLVWKHFLSRYNGHSGDPLHEEADRLVVEGAENEVDDDGILYSSSIGQEIVFKWTDGKGKQQSHTWCATVQKRIRTHAASIVWEVRSGMTYAGAFLAGPNTARQQSHHVPSPCVPFVFII